MSATGSKVSSAQREKSGTSQEEGMTSLFGTVVPGKQAEEITTAAQWEKTVSALDQNAMVWFIAQGAGTIPQLYFTSAEVLLTGKSYRLTDPAALTAFAQWTAALVQKEMQNAFPLSVPLLAEVNYGKDWASAK